MKALGRHLIAEYYDCDADLLNDLDALRAALKKAAKICGATVVGETYHAFEPNGVSATVLIAESHLSLHTWPRQGYAAVDIFTCGGLDPRPGFEYLGEALEASSLRMQEILRGLPDDLADHNLILPEDVQVATEMGEIRPIGRHIMPASTSTAGFVGLTERGPVTPRLVTDWESYLGFFGGRGVPESDGGSYLPYAVKGFFDNGGKRAYVTRVMGADACHASAALNGADRAALEVKAIGGGAWGNRMLITVRDSVDSGDGFFDLVVRYFDQDISDVEASPHPSLPHPDKVETFERLTAAHGSPNDAVDVVNSSSVLVRLSWTGEPARPQTPSEIRLTGGQDSPTNAADFLAGLESQKPIEEISLVVVPDAVHAAIADRAEIVEAVVSQCESLRDRFAVFSVERGAMEASIRETAYAASYAPWIRVDGPLSVGSVLVPAAGHIAGAYAEVDQERGVWAAPANVVLRGLSEAGDPAAGDPVEKVLTQAEQESWAALGINVIRDLSKAGQGVRLRGARTLSRDPQWLYISIRRLAIFVEKSIVQGTRWTRFEAHDEATWARLESSVIDFLHALWRQKRLQGTRPDDAYFVRCDRTTMTQADIDAGRLILEVGIAPVTPKEFLVLRLEQSLLSQAVSVPESLSTMAPRSFGSENGVELELPPRLPHEPVDFSE